MTEFKKGDRVKVEYIAALEDVQTSSILGVRTPDDRYFIAPYDAVTRIEPDWQPGDVVRDEDGWLWQRCEEDRDCWISAGAGEHFDRDADPGLSGRLTRLVPEDPS